MSEAKIVFWDVEHGHAAYLKSPNGRHVVIDLGIGSYGSGAEFSPLNHLKNQYGVSQLDYVVITHPHVDHIDDILNFDSLNPKTLSAPAHLDKKPILENVSNKDKTKFEKYFEICERYDVVIPKTDPKSTINPTNWGGLKMEAFKPSECSQSNLNNHSVVIVFSFEEIGILVPGDNEPPSWNELNEIVGFKECTKNIDILLAPHHGRKSGFDIDTMKHFNPRITIVSDGSYCDTSATSRYTEISRGWTVFKDNGTSEKRYCLTTRNDGVISVSFGNGADGKPFLHVKTGQ